jgi:hypothetical protein
VAEAKQAFGAGELAKLFKSVTTAG